MAKITEEYTKEEIFKIGLDTVVNKLAKKGLRQFKVTQVKTQYTVFENSVQLHVFTGDNL